VKDRSHPAMERELSTSGDAEHFASVDAAEKWFEENDPEGVAFEYRFWKGRRSIPSRDVACRRLCGSFQHSRS
jgi:hypothetical protein